MPDSTLPITKRRRPSTKPVGDWTGDSSVTQKSKMETGGNTFTPTRRLAPNKNVTTKFSAPSMLKAKKSKLVRKTGRISKIPLLKKKRLFSYLGKKRV